MRTTIYLAVLTGLFIAIGFLLGGSEGAVLAFVLALAMNFASYWWSSTIVLKLYGAQPMSRQEYPWIFEAIEDLAVKASLPMPGVYLIPTEAPNAFATGRNEKHAVVGITQGILGLLSEEELRGVLAHELSHIKNRDVLVSTMAATLAGAISLIGRLAYFGGSDNENRSNAISFLLLVIVTPIIAMLIQLAISRSREYGADKSGAHLLGDGSALASALQKLGSFSKTHPVQGTPAQEAAAHLFIVNPFRASLFMSLLSTHPPMEERVKRLRAFPSLASSKG
jgi:heat shock protein HtpX